MQRRFAVCAVACQARGMGSGLAHRLGLVGLCALSASACNVQMHAESSLNGSGSGTSTAAAEPKHKSTHKKTSKSHGHSVSASWHDSGSISGHVEWHGRSGQLCRAIAPFRFVGTAHLAGTAHLNPDGSWTTSGNAQSSGKTSGGASGANTCAAPRNAIPQTPPPTPVKEHPPAQSKSPQWGSDSKAPSPKAQWGSDSKAPPTKAQWGSDSKAPPAKPPAAEPSPPTTPPGPTPGELETPVDPPKEPPSNVFGYPTPVKGCFEGQVFPLQENTQKLPTDYAPLKPVSVLYACEWDIPPRAWDQGFPGVADRFEWFAIRYAGAFHLSAGGDYAFRISSDDGTKLVIDGKLVIDNDGVHPPAQAKGHVQLAAGDHDMVLEYFQGPRYQINLQLWVTPPGKPEEIFTVR